MKQLEMKKLPIYAKILVVLAIATVAVGVLSFLPNQNRLMPVQPGLEINSKVASVSNGNYNISVSIHALKSSTVQRILVNPGNFEGEQFIEASGLSTYLNGTAVSMARPVSYQLKSGDYLQVNVIMPFVEARQSQNEVTLSTSNPHCTYWLMLNLDQNPTAGT
jgi:hypothetical protein